MTRGVRLYLVGSFVLVSLAGCGRGFFQSEEREPWRAEAEIACLKSGAVKENADLVRISPISGPGICGAEFPLKVAAFDEGSSSFGFADDDLRPPANRRQPAALADLASPAAAAALSRQRDAPARLRHGSGGPISLTAPGVARDQGEIELPPDGTPESAEQGVGPMARSLRRDRLGLSAAGSAAAAAWTGTGPGQGNPVAAFGPVAVKPVATLACPIVSVLDRWLADSVQPAAMRWFGQRVVEIKQISAYSCRGMNGNPNAHISEHAFGNALDIAAFTLADGRRVSVKDGWRGMPEEQGFLHDVQATACQHFNTVLAPGSNVYHYDHIHVDLMRRASRRQICQPAAMSGEEVAARVSGHSPYASREAMVTGSLGGKTSSHRQKVNEEDEFEDQ